MLEWHIEILIFDSDKKKQFSIEAEDLCKAKQAALQEFRRHSPIKNKNLYLEANGKCIYTIVSNLTDVGKIKIERINS